MKTFIYKSFKILMMLSFHVFLPVFGIDHCHMIFVKQLAGGFFVAAEFSKLVNLEKYINTFTEIKV